MKRDPIDRRRRVIGVGLASLFIAGAMAIGPSAPAATSAGSEAVPDLSMAPVSDFRIRWVGGRKLLRFTAMMVNIGDGHFEVRGSRDSASEPMAVRQILFQTSARDSAVARSITTDAVAKYSGDGHNHWHVQEMMRYDLWGGTERVRGAKVGFCFLDSDPYNLSLPGAGSSYYRGSWCGTDPNALRYRMGISIGWGDEYTWDLAWQWVDITNLPPGTYTLRAKVDPYGFFVEQKEGNQCAYAKLAITATTVTVKSRGKGCVNDWAGSRFASEIAWMYANEITTGCALDLYCPHDPVKRDQMASFLRRALALPHTATDFFTDDERNAHETNINRLAASAITTGCAKDRYCPRTLVKRGQMATFLARALSLPPGTRDYFDDDDGTEHEDSINRIAEAGITTGCGPTRSFCPTDTVSRGQMAAFLYRALRGA